MATDYGTFYWPVGSGGGGGGGGGNLASGQVAIGNGVQTVTVTYDVTLNTAYAPDVSFINTTDNPFIFLQGIVTAFSTTGFTIKLNAPTDSANYKLLYTVSTPV